MDNQVVIISGETGCGKTTQVSIRSNHIIQVKFLCACLSVNMSRKVELSFPRNCRISVWLSLTRSPKQVPQYILEEATANQSHCFMYVTQPRRIAAIAAAERVSQVLKLFYHLVSDTLSANIRYLIQYQNVI